MSAISDLYNALTFAFALERHIQTFTGVPGTANPPYPALGINKVNGDLYTWARDLAAWVKVGAAPGMEDGTVAAPGWPFIHDTDTGFYRPAANKLAIAANGTFSAAFIAGQALFAVGSAPSPSIACTVESTTGLYFADDRGTSEVWVAGNGVGVARLSKAGTRIYQAAQTSGTPKALHVTGGVHTKMPVAEIVDAYFGFGTDLHDAVRTIGIAGGGGVLGSQRVVVFTAPQYDGGGAGLTITNAATVAIEGSPKSGAGGTVLTDSWSLWVQADPVRFDDRVFISSGGAALPGLGFVAERGTGIYLAGAGQLGFSAGGASAGTLSAAALTLPTQYLDVSEIAAPAAPAANGARIYAVDNGAGKTQLMVIFHTGAAQQIAIEP